MEHKITGLRLNDFMEMMENISGGKPTKKKPFTFIKGHCYFNGEDIGAQSFKNDGENIYVIVDGIDKKICHEEFMKNIIKFI